MFDSEFRLARNGCPTRCKFFQTNNPGFCRLAVSEVIERKTRVINCHFPVPSIPKEDFSKQKMTINDLSWPAMLPLPESLQTDDHGHRPKGIRLSDIPFIFQKIITSRIL